MRTSEILISPRITEKANGQMEKRNRYTFVVDKRANKTEIKAAIEDFYKVKVTDVNTSVTPAKNKSRYTKTGFVSGRKQGFKKAIITLAEGEMIDLFEF